MIRGNMKETRRTGKGEGEKEEVVRDRSKERRRRGGRRRFKGDKVEEEEEEEGLR